MDAELRFAVLKCVSEMEIGGRIVSRIAAEDNKQVDLAALYVVDEFFQ